MPRRQLRLHATWLAVVVACSSASGQVAPERWRVVATEAHAAGDWGARDGALRRLAQTRRLAGADAEHFAQDVSPSEALTVYGEVVDHLARQAGAKPGELFRSGVLELSRAVETPAFLAANFNPATPLAPLREALSRWGHAEPTTPLIAREAALTMTRELRARHGLRRPAAVALELAAGACAEVDPYTRFHPDSRVEKSIAGGVRVVSRCADDFEIRIDGFTESTAGELDAALREATRVGAEGVTLDLRDNPGGTLDAALAVCGRFVLGGAAGGTKFGELPATGPRLWAGPLRILVDGRTASGAELVAATLQERGRARIVGEATFGKGRVQSAPIALTRGCLVVTVAELATPEGVPIERRGVQPDSPLNARLVSAR